MIMLKKAGYINKQIEDLVEGAWSETTIKLYTRGTNIEDFLSFVDEAKKSNVNLKTLFQMYNSFKEIDPSLGNLTESIRYKIELEGLGFTFDKLKQLLEISRKYGSFNNLIEAINAFTTLDAIQQEIKDLESQKQQSRQQLDSLRTEVKTLEDKKDQIQGILKLYNELKQKGLDNDVIMK